MIRDNLIQNCPVTVADATRSLQIYGPDVGSIRGKTTRSAPHHVSSDLIADLPSYILEKHQRITLCIDLFFVDGLAFFGTISRDIRFVTVEHISSRHILKNILPCLSRVNNLYRARGFRIVMCHADDEFAFIRDSLLALGNIGLNIAATNEHVPEIERAIRTIKERNRAVVNTLPFTHYPKLLKLALISSAATWMNLFPHANGVSDLLSPRTIMTGTTLNFHTHCRLPFGAYCEIHNEPSPTNTETSRTTPAIALHPSGNLQGSYHFLSLVTGRRVTRRNWSELPITDPVVARVNALALQEKANTPGTLPPTTPFQFTWAPDQPIVDLPHVHPGHGDPAVPAPPVGAPHAAHINTNPQEQGARNIEAQGAHNPNATQGQGYIQDQGAHDSKTTEAAEAQGAHKDDILIDEIIPVIEEPATDVEDDEDDQIIWLPDEPGHPESLPNDTQDEQHIPNDHL